MTSTGRRAVHLGCAVAALLASSLSVPMRADETLWYRSLGVEEGLSQNFVTAIAQDRDGFMWFGTIGALDRWNGYEFESFTHVFGDPASLSAPTVLALHVDRNGGLWVGTTRGLDRFNPGTSSFERIGGLSVGQHGDALPIEGITSDRAGRIWFASFAGGRIGQFDPWTRQSREYVVPGVGPRWVTMLHVDSADRLWVATQPADEALVGGDSPYRLMAFDRCGDIADGGLPAPRAPMSLDAAGGKVAATIEDLAHRLWIGRNGGGLIRYDPATGAVDRATDDTAGPDGVSLRNVKNLALAPAGEIWAIAQAPTSASPGSSRLYRVDAETLAARAVTLRERVTRPGEGARIDRVAVDRSGVLWVGSNAAGLRYADISATGFTLYREATPAWPGLDSGFVRAVAKGRDGTVWVGTPRGVNRLDRSAREVRYSSPFPAAGGSLPDPSVQAILEDRGGNLWVGTPRGVVVLEPSGKVRRYRHEAGNPDSLAEDWVQVIHEDHRGSVWIGTFGRGLSEFDPRTGSFVTWRSKPGDATGLPGGAINAVFSGAGNTLWVGTSEGLARLDLSPGAARTFERVAAEATALGGATVLSMAESVATPGTLWVGTGQRGLCRLEVQHESVRCFTTRNSALADNTIYGVLADAGGRLWMSTNRGLVRHDPATGAFRTYGPGRGLQSSEFNALAFFKAPDGEMFFGGVAGLNAFYPERVIDNPHAPVVLVTGVTALDRDAPGPQPAARQIYRRGMPVRTTRIEYGQRDITFDYVALHYSDAERNRYLFRLDNYDADWQGPAAARSARYTNLDPGPYTFRVKAVSSDGVPSSEESTFSFVVLPPFYATWWFRACALGCLVLALVGAYRVRVHRLRRRHDELEHEVASRTEELRRALETLEEQARKLKELDAAKSRFFANVSHEFRTPLTLTLGPLRDVRAGRHGPITPEARDEIDLAIRSTSQQLELVDQLLALARLDAGRLDFRPRLLRLDECVRLAAAPYEALARRQETRLGLDFPDAAVHAVVDEEKLERVIGNLLGNALKFTAPGGAVTLKLVDARDGWAAIEVEDTGPGIPPEDLPHVFERFYRSEHAVGQVPGSGIGLALAKEYVGLHGGDIRAENRPGGGTRVVVRLRTAPAGSDQPPAVAPAATTGAASEEACAADAVDALYGDASATAEPSEAGLPTVLVVDDNADMRAYLRKHLGPHYAVREAARGDDALEQVRAELPDVVVSDVMMPGMDGYALCRAIRSSPETDFVPVILLTAKAGAEGRLEGLEGGADDYVTKPFEPAELLARVRNLLRTRERLKARFTPAPGAPVLLALPQPVPAADEVLLAKVRAALDEAAHEEAFDVTSLASGVGMSRAQLHRRVKEAFGSTPAELIIQYRLERAAQLLERQTGSVGEVAYAVGFKNVSHFVKRFRERYGSTPATWAAARKVPPDAPVGR